MKRFLLILLLILTIAEIMGQSVLAPSARTYSQNTTNQNASGFSISGFNATTNLLITVGLVNPPSGTTLRFSTTSGVSASTGYSLTSNFTRISFTGTQSNINTVLSSLLVNTGSVPGNVYIAVTATENPTGFFYLPSNGHFYRPISTTATYSSAKSAAAATIFKGQTGYLVTITSSDEDAFIFNNVPQSQIWFALSDVAQEGFWRIDAGPENGTLIKTSNGQFTGNIAGQYNKMDSKIKRKILNYFNPNSSNYVYMESFLFSKKYFSLYASLLLVDINLLEEVGELCSKPDMEKETLILEVYTNKKIIN
jgi:hypothetical protein